MAKTIILDLDNCISNDGWRIPKINWSHEHPDLRYHDYHLLAAFDEAGNHDLFDTETHGCQIAIFTARPIMYKAITQEWLKRNGVPCHHLLMRNVNDMRKSVDLKRHQLNWLRSHYGVPRTHIVAAYDDRQDVVDMYREHGVVAAVRSLHSVCAYTKPDAAQSHK